MAIDVFITETWSAVLPVGDVELRGDLTIPDGARGIVLFAHGSGSSRLSRRNQFVARQLNEGGLATLLFDLLTPAEEQEDALRGHLRFDIGLLAGRLIAATDEIRGHSDTRRLRVGYFGASVGAAAALVAAAQRAEVVSAVVSRGGRPDLAGETLTQVRAPTLLIVGGADHPVMEINGAAFEQLRTEKRLEIIAGATHLFEEEGALEEVARLARDWFSQHFLGGLLEEPPPGEGTAPEAP
jgi:putative phosphoribosyl transferase